MKCPQKCTLPLISRIWILLVWINPVQHMAKNSSSCPCVIWTTIQWKCGCKVLHYCVLRWVKSKLFYVMVNMNYHWFIFHKTVGENVYFFGVFTRVKDIPCNMVSGILMLRLPTHFTNDGGPVLRYVLFWKKKWSITNIPLCTQHSISRHSVLPSDKAQQPDYFSVPSCHKIEQ